MANPQLENGYTSIANELLEALFSHHLSGQELRMILFVIRKTYGFHKKDDFISLTQMAQALKNSKIRCSQIVKGLELRKILTVNKNINGIGKSYILNKDFDKWQGVNKNINGISKHKLGVYKNINGGYIKTLTTKETLTKDTYTKDTLLLPKKFGNDSIEFKLADLLFTLIKKRNPNHKPPDLQKWTKHIDLMIRIDKRHPENIKRVIKWCQNDDFWQNNILSTKKLRKQYDQLFLKMTKNNKPKWQAGIEEWLRMHGEIE